MKRLDQFDINIADEIRKVTWNSKRMCFQLINAGTCKEETALFPEVGVYHSVRYVLIGLGQGLCY